MRTSEEIIVEHRVLAPPEDVFPFFTDPQRHVLWQGIECDLDPRPGGRYRVRYDTQTWISGRYLELDPPRRLVLSWGWDAADMEALLTSSRYLLAAPALDGDQRPGSWPAPGELAQEMARVGAGTTIVEIDLVADGPATIIRVRHSGFPTPMATTLHRVGWDFLLPKLGAVAAAGVAG